MQVFHYTFSSPLQAENIDLGTIEGERMVSYFLDYPWADWLLKMEGVKEGDIYFSPTLNFENKETKQKILVSAVGDRAGFVFYVFYQRPIMVNHFFGLRQKYKEDHTTEVLHQSKEKTALLVEAFAKGNNTYLEEEIKY
ncbi:hypothetical protein [Rufibacter sp. XAAS-G3-1]|uniref:hypothetical protein n=1 Tax=Rufibacter sp. XAAS-G3-1 TaxID=2729134 RepID=UPI0015E79371|nr:hypothetical protein [Rufibacter sp. XAAS-G3-1]